MMISKVTRAGILSILLFSTAGWSEGMLGHTPYPVEGHDGLFLIAGGQKAPIALVFNQTAVVGYHAVTGFDAHIPRIKRVPNIVFAGRKSIGGNYEIYVYIPESSLAFDMRSPAYSRFAKIFNEGNLTIRQLFYSKTDRVTVVDDDEQGSGRSYRIPKATRIIGERRYYSEKANRVITETVDLVF